MLHMLIFKTVYLTNEHKQKRLHSLQGPWTN